MRTSTMKTKLRQIIRVSLNKRSWCYTKQFSLGSINRHFLVTNSFLKAVVFTQCSFVTSVLDVVPFNMSFYLLSPDEPLAAYMALVLKFFCVTTFMLLEVLLHFGAEVVANCTDEHLAGVCFGVCY